MKPGSFKLQTNRQMEMIDITDQIHTILAGVDEFEGFCYLFNPHTTAGLTINEGADPDVQDDIIRAMQHIGPMNFNYRHAEGNSPAHIMASMMGCSLQIAVTNRRMLLGTWQRIFFCEFDGPRMRTVHYRFSASSFKE